mgnify:CR=1 FL=1
MDEFQDTSPDQLDLVHALIRGWDDDIERSLFPVSYTHLTLPTSDLV